MPRPDEIALQDVLREQRDAARPRDWFRQVWRRRREEERAASLSSGAGK